METTLERISSFVFGLICHQETSFLLTIDGKEVLLCPRCIGLHIGFLSSFVLIWLWCRGRIQVVRVLSPAIIAISLLAVLVDWAGGQLGLWHTTSFSRLITGLAGGSAFSFLTVLYRWRTLNPSVTGSSRLTIIRHGILVSFSLVAGLALVTLSTWTVLTSAVVLAVIINAFIIGHTVVLVLRSHSVCPVRIATF